MLGAEDGAPPRGSFEGFARSFRRRSFRRSSAVLGAYSSGAVKTVQSSLSLCASPACEFLCLSQRKTMRIAKDAISVRRRRTGLITLSQGRRVTWRRGGGFFGVAPVSADLTCGGGCHVGPSVHGSTHACPCLVSSTLVSSVPLATRPVTAQERERARVSDRGVTSAKRAKRTHRLSKINHTSASSVTNGVAGVGCACVRNIFINKPRGLQAEHGAGKREARDAHDLKKGCPPNFPARSCRTTD